MTAKAIPEGYHSVTPYIIVKGAAKALDFYARAFGAKEKLRLPMGDIIGHAEIVIGDSPAALAARIARPAIWRGGACPPEPASVPTGHAALDAVLPGGGWPGAGLTEMLLMREGIGEIALMLPALCALQRLRRDIVWVAPP